MENGAAGSPAALLAYLAAVLVLALVLIAVLVVLLLVVVLVHLLIIHVDYLRIFGCYGLAVTIGCP